jgi:hypothetical protein
MKHVAGILLFLCSITPASAQTGADLEIFVQKFPITSGEPTNASVTYFVDVWNYGPADAENVVVTDVLPVGAAFESTPSEECSFVESTRTIRCERGTLSPATGMSLAFVLRAPAAPTTMENTARVASSTTDPNPANDFMTVAIDVVQFKLSDLAMTMTASAESVLVHRAVTFTSTVTNRGPSAATSVTWSSYPPFLSDVISIKPSQGACQTTTDEIVCALGALAVNASATVTLEVKPQNDGFVSNFASVSGENDPSFFDVDDSNDFAFAAVDVKYPGKADPAYSTTVRQDLPYSTLVYNPCAGEAVGIAGTLRKVMSSTTNQVWNRTRVFTSYQDLQGVAMTSGTLYRAIGVSHESKSIYSGFFPRTFTTVDNFKLVPEGAGETLLLHQTTHVTINADGTATATVDNPKLECK